MIEVCGNIHIFHFHIFHTDIMVKHLYCKSVSFVKVKNISLPTVVGSITDSCRQRIILCYFQGDFGIFQKSNSNGFEMKKTRTLMKISMTGSFCFRLYSVE